jgi:hypothetical protein
MRLTYQKNYNIRLTRDKNYQVNIIFLSLEYERFVAFDLKFARELLEERNLL